MDGEQEDIDDLNSMRQVKELMTQMKNIYGKLEHESKNLDSKATSIGITGAGAAEIHKDLERRKTMMSKDGVGDLEEIGEFGLGLAPRTSKP